MQGDHVCRKNGTVGYPSIYADVVVRDDDNNTVSAGEVGEMRVRGPIVMASYCNARDATREAFDPDGYFCTAIWSSRTRKASSVSSTARRT